MEKTENKQTNKKQEAQSVSENRGSSKIKYEIRNISGQDLTVCGVRINPYEKLRVELKEIPKNLKRLEEKGLIVISEVN